MINPAVDCGPLDSRGSFKTYIETVNTTLHGNFTQSSECKAEICSTLYGFGNADIDGVGMVTAYIMVNVLASLAPLLLLEAIHGRDIAERSSNNIRNWMVHYVHRIAIIYKPRGRQTIEEIVKGLFEASVVLSFSVQIACIVVLTRLDYGISSSGMGDTTSKIAQAVSLALIIPLTYSITIDALMRSYRGRQYSNRISTAAIESIESTEHGSDENATNQDGAVNSSELVAVLADRECKLRLYVFVACWVVALIPMITTFFAYFRPSQIGTGSGSVIAPQDFAELIEPCFENVQALSGPEEKAIETLAVCGVISVSVFTLLQVSMHGLTNKWPESFFTQLCHRSSSVKAQTVVFYLLMASMAVGQFWIIFRLQKLQKQMAITAGSGYTDNEWGFGQIVALTLLLPILVKSLYKFISYGPDEHDKFEPHIELIQPLRSS